VKVLVLGAGVIGVTSAWYLAKAGHQVTVVERNPGTALETSFGNAGGVCPSFAGPWAAPGMPFKAVKWMLQPAAPLKVRPKLDMRQWTWLAAFLANCTKSRFQANKARMQRIAHYSQSCLRELRAETGIEYDNQVAGVLQLFQTDQELANGHLAAAVLADLGIKHRIVTAPEALKIEPALAQSSVPIAGGLHMPDDETGDSHKFCVDLAKRLVGLGVIFLYDTSVRRIEHDSSQITHVVTDKGELTADAYVVALGPEVAAMLRPLNIRVPVYPVKGYSITGALKREQPAPRSSVMDEHSKIMVTRLGDRLRAAGMAEITGFDPNLNRKSVASLIASAKNLFPQAIDYESCEVWTGFRPMTPDGPPLLGKTRFANLYLNIGHGSNGWTQACGASRIVADIVSGKPADIDLGGLTYLPAS